MDNNQSDQNSSFVKLYMPSPSKQLEALDNNENFIKDQSQVNEFNIQRLKEEIYQLNYYLNLYGFSFIGDLFKNTLEDVDQTIKTIFSLLQSQQQYMEFKKEGLQKTLQIEKEKNQFQQIIEQLNLKIKTVEKERDNLLHKLNVIEGQQNQLNKEMESEYKKVQTDYNKAVSKEDQFKNEFRKKEQDFNKLSQQLSKMQKEKNNYKNSTEIVYNLTNQNQSVFSESDRENYKLLSTNYNDILQKITQENDNLRECIFLIHNELGEMLDQKKQQYVNKKKMESQDYIEQEDQLIQNLIPLKKELFNLPLEKFGKQTLEIVQFNIKRFRETIDNMEIQQPQMDVEFNMNCDNDIEKQKVFKTMKQMITNYKQIILTQEDLLYKSISKHNDYQMPVELSDYQKPQKNVSDNDMDAVKSFLQQQTNYIAEKQKELEITKIYLNNSVQKLEDEKNGIIEKRKDMENEAEEFKENLINMLNNAKNIIQEIVEDDNDQMDIQYHE